MAQRATHGTPGLSLPTSTYAVVVAVNQRQANAIANIPLLPGPASHPATGLANRHPEYKPRPGGPVTVPDP